MKSNYSTCPQNKRIITEHCFETISVAWCMMEVNKKPKCLCQSEDWKKICVSRCLPETLQRIVEVSFDSVGWCRRHVFKRVYCCKDWACWACIISKARKLVCTFDKFCCHLTRFWCSSCQCWRPKVRCVVDVMMTFFWSWSIFTCTALVLTTAIVKLQQNSLQL